MKSKIAATMLSFLLVLTLPALLPAQTEADTTRVSSSFIAIPGGGYQPETRWFGGLFGNYVFALDYPARPSSITASAMYTQNNQFLTTLDWELYTRKNDYRITGYTYFKLWPDKFYGLGGNTLESAEESYTIRSLSMRLNVMKQYTPGFYAGVHGEYHSASLTKTDAGRTLSPGTLAGSKPYLTAGIGVACSYDTRDFIFFPSRGVFVHTLLTVYGAALGSDFGYSKYLLDARAYHAFPGENIIAGQVYVSTLSSVVPFDMLLSPGSGLGRGYRTGRYCDRAMMTVQGEYRSPFLWLFGAAAFAGFTDIAYDAASFALHDFKPFAGAGLRFRFDSDNRVNLRFDVGFGKDGANYYIEIMEAF